MLKYSHDQWRTSLTISLLQTLLIDHVSALTLCLSLSLSSSVSRTNHIPACSSSILRSQVCKSASFRSGRPSVREIAECQSCGEPLERLHQMDAEHTEPAAMYEVGGRPCGWLSSIGTCDVASCHSTFPPLICTRQFSTCNRSRPPVLCY